MGEAQPHIDNDITDLKGKSNVYDTDNARSEMWQEICKDAREDVLEEISEYKLRLIQRFLFGGPSKQFGDNIVFINPAIKQIERFTYTWMNDLSEESRKSIINLTMYDSDDTRTRDYSCYTNSPVWKYISSVIKMYSNYTCANCGKKYNPAHLVVHHRSYAHLGSELDHLNDLAVLCTDCHMKVHGIRREK